jgi:predicted transglutaminase-like cysteine proteinase
MLRLFNKHGDLTYNPPVPAGWEGVLQSIDRWYDPVFERSDLYTDLARVHHFVHGMIVQRTDMEIYKMPEVWATPFKIMTNGEGDCEDHAILKWAVLHAMGYSMREFSIACVTNRQKGEYHAVLVHMGGNGNTILDSLYPRIYPDYQQGWYDPVYAFGYNQNWIFR